MKIYIKIKGNVFRNQNDMTKILVYLLSNGNLGVSAITVERLYRCYSSEKYGCYWKTLNDKVLEGFADWLSTTEF